MIVVDTNLIAYLFLTSPSSPYAEQALLKDPQWAAPMLWRSEFRSVLALYLRKRRLSLDDARQIMNEALQLLADQEYEVDSEHVLQLASQSACSACDCEFVSPAQSLGTPLVTADRRILKEFPRVAVSLTSFIGERNGLAHPPTWGLYTNRYSTLYTPMIT